MRQRRGEFDYTAEAGWPRQVSRGRRQTWQTFVGEGACAGVPMRWTVSAPPRPDGSAGPGIAGKFIADLPSSEVRKRYGETSPVVNPAGVPSGKRVAYRCLVKGREVVFTSTICRQLSSGSPSGARRLGTSCSWPVGRRALPRMWRCRRRPSTIRQLCDTWLRSSCGRGLAGIDQPLSIGGHQMHCPASNNLKWVRSPGGPRDRISRAASANPQPTPFGRQSARRKAFYSHSGQARHHDRGCLKRRRSSRSDFPPWKVSARAFLRSGRARLKRASAEWT